MEHSKNAIPPFFKEKHFWGRGHNGGQVPQQSKGDGSRAFHLLSENFQSWKEDGGGRGVATLNSIKTIIEFTKSKGSQNYEKISLSYIKLSDFIYFMNFMSSWHCTLFCPSPKIVKSIRLRELMDQGHPVSLIASKDLNSNSIDAQTPETQIPIHHSGWLQILYLDQLLNVQRVVMHPIINVKKNLPLQSALLYKGSANPQTMGNSRGTSFTWCISLQRNKHWKVIYLWNIHFHIFKRRMLEAMKLVKWAGSKNISPASDPQRVTPSSCQPWIFFSLINDS